MVERIESDSSEPQPLRWVRSPLTSSPPWGEGKNLGGAASHCSPAASTHQVRMVGVIGNDFGEEHLERLRSRVLDLEGV